jgi:CcmD family protein
MNKRKYLSSGLLTLALGALTVTALSAQELPGAAMAEQSLRPYWHVFIAYAIAIALVLGWVISIGRRLKDVEERLGQ